MSGVIRNQPTPEGRALGEQLARLTDTAEIEVRKQFPNHDERCASCAFKAGTFPNGCLTTVADATKCAVEGTPFFCHHNLDGDKNPTELCAGWMIAQTALMDAPVKNLPYEFSKPVGDVNASI